VTVLVTLTLGLVWWIVAWSFDIKPFDAFLLTVLMVVMAATYTIARPFVDRLLGREGPPADDRGGVA
jgi:VIT1/CCC1 family predicted Fe2+/Mn2+ transporter